jgi:hypothetical protein
MPKVMLAGTETRTREEDVCSLIIQAFTYTSHNVLLVTQQLSIYDGTSSGRGLLNERKLPKVELVLRVCGDRGRNNIVDWSYCSCCSEAGRIP